MTRTAFSLGAAAVLGAAITHTIGSAQQRDRPAAAIAQAAAAAGGRISGVVRLAAPGDEPVRRAVVSVIAADGGDGTSTITDDEGRFAIAGLPDGRYAVVAQKPAYLAAHYGAKRPGRSGVSVVVADGRAVDGLRIAIAKGAVITGRLVQANGAPFRNLQVLAIPLSEISSNARFDTRARPFFSDDQGIYRIYGLPPGDYVVGAVPPPVGLADVERRTADQYDAAVRALSGGRIVDGGVMARRITRVGYATIYHPGTPIAADARPVRVSPGEERDGIDIPVTMFALSEISGTVTGLDGRPTGAVQLTVTASTPPLPPGGGGPFRRDVSPDPQGRFRITNVPPGLYTLLARGGGVTLDARGTTIRDAGQTDWAMARVQAVGDDIEGVMLALQPGLTFSGRVETKGASPALAGTRIALLTPDGQLTSARTAPVDDRGAFSVAGIHPDTYEIVVLLPSAMAQQWMVGSVTAGGVDLRDQPLTFERGSIGDVTLTLTDRRTEVAGTLTTSNGAPTSDCFVIAFPDARALWHPRSPRVRVVRPNADGTFSLRDLPAGAYRLAALTDVDGEEWRQPSFLEALLGSSVPIVVKDGATTRQDLQVQ